MSLTQTPREYGDDGPAASVIAAPVAAHAPLPWRFERDGGGPARAIIGAGGEVLAQTRNGADAAMICRAVNCHDDLLAACKLAESLAPYIDEPAFDGRTGAIFHAIDAAIRKARG